MKTDELVKWIKKLELEDKMYKFYKSKYFMNLRKRIFMECHNECAYCRMKGKISKATVLHHEFHVDIYPQYALSEFVNIINDNGEVERVRNLVPCCSHCHLYVCHPEKIEDRNRRARERNEKAIKDNWINEEKW